MTGGPLWAEVLFAFALAAAFYSVFRYCKARDGERGRRAYYDGQLYDHRWNEEVKKGWRDARSKAQRFQLEEWEREARRHK